MASPSVGSNPTSSVEMLGTKRAPFAYEWRPFSLFLLGVYRRFRVIVAKTVAILAADPPPPCLSAYARLPHLLSAERVVHEPGRLSLHRRQRRGVGVQRQRRGGVPQRLRHDLHVDAAAQHRRRRRVSQIVKS